MTKHAEIWPLLPKAGVEQLIGSRLRRGTTGRLLSSCWFNLYAEHSMRNARLSKLEAGAKTEGRDINNLRYADDTT